MVHALFYWFVERPELARHLQTLYKYSSFFKIKTQSSWKWWGRVGSESSFVPCQHFFLLTGIKYRRPVSLLCSSITSLEWIFFPLFLHIRVQIYIRNMYEWMNEVPCWYINWCFLWLFFKELAIIVAEGFSPLKIDTCIYTYDSINFPGIYQFTEDHLSMFLMVSIVGWETSWIDHNAL